MTRRDFLFASLTVPCWSLTSYSNEEKNGLIRYANPRRYQAKHQATFMNSDQKLTSVEIWLPCPRSWPEQTVHAIKASHGAKRLPDITDSMNIARFEIRDDLPGEGQALTATLEHQITARAIQVDGKALMRSAFRAFRQDREFRKYTRPEAKMEITEKDIASKAEKLRGKRRPAASIARDTYDWILGRTSYRDLQGFRGAKFCLSEGVGNCGDYTALFVALCRAAGVPARPVIGIWADRRNGWLPSGESIPVDPSVGDQNARNRDYFFGSLDNRRVVLGKTYDVRLKQKLPRDRQISYLQAGVWWYRSKGGRRQPRASFQIESRKV